MIDALPEGFKNGYNNDRIVLRSEAIAEFLRMYIMDEAQARAFSGPEFFTRFVERLSDTDMRILEDVRSAYHSFADAPVTEKNPRRHSVPRRYKERRWFKHQGSDDYLSFRQLSPIAYYRPRNKRASKQDG